MKDVLARMGVILLALLIMVLAPFMLSWQLFIALVSSEMPSPKYDDYGEPSRYGNYLDEDPH